MTDTQGFFQVSFKIPSLGFGFGHLIGTFFIPSETWLVGDALLASHARSGTATPARDSLVCHVARCATVCLTLQQCATHCQCHTALVCHVAGVARVRGAPPLLSLHHWPARFSNQVLLLIKRPDSNNCACLHF